MRPTEIYLIHHTHVDIGYTEPQAVILRKHAEFVAAALDYCTATDSLPPGERFCWTCEASWTVKAFLARYPERAEEFFERVREGRIEVTGLYLQLTDLYAEPLLRATLDYAGEIAERSGVPVVTAMNDDVNGWAWGLPKLMAARGIRYFDVAINETRARGVRPRPAPFYWASPGGERVLMWHGDGYLCGNRMGFDRPGAEERVGAWLDHLEESGYPHRVVAMRIHGEHHDNAPPGLWISDAVRRWNDTHDVKLRFTLARDWFAEIEAHWPEPIPELRKGWPDWWADGNGTALYESALVRAAQADFDAIDALGAPVDRERLAAAHDAAMFFCEHTWGAWDSTDDPDGLNARSQWNWKAGYAYTAGVEAQSLLDEALKAATPPLPFMGRGLGGGVTNGEGLGSEIAVYNPLPVLRTDIVEVLVSDIQLGVEGTWVTGPVRLDDGPPCHLVDAETGEAVPVQRIPAVADSARRAGQRLRFIACGVPAGGWRRYALLPGDIPARPATRQYDTVLENRHFRLTLGADGITSLQTAAGRELVAAGDYRLGQCVYETIDSPESREALCKWGQLRTDAPFTRTTPAASIMPGPALPFGAALRLNGGGALPRASLEITLYDDLPRVDLAVTLEKDFTAAAEAVYHAFPLAAVPPTVYLDVPGAVLRPGLDQVPGTATDWHSIQHYFAVGDDAGATVVASPDVPLVQVNGINTGMWQETLPPHTGLVMSWALNNYWFTNFPARQGGTLRYRYSLAALPGPFDPAAAALFAAHLRQPLRGVVL
jgi:hypothetical protein